MSSRKETLNPQIVQTSTPAKIHQVRTDEADPNFNIVRHQDEQSEINANDNDADAISIVTMADISNITEWNQISDDKENQTTASNHSFRLSQSILEDQLIISGIQDDVQDNNDVFAETNRKKSRGNQETNSTIDNSKSVHNDENQSIVVIAEVHWDTSVNSPIPTSARMKAKPRVGFDAAHTVYELNKISRETDIDDINPLIMIKGGKWRRTIFELRKNKITRCKLYTITE